MRTDGRRPIGGRATALLMLCAALLAAAGPLRAEVNTQARLDALSRLPDWTGVWELDGSSATLEPVTAGDGSPRDHAPYTEAWETRYAQTRASLSTLRDTNDRYCAAGVPRLMGAGIRFVAVVTPEETLLHFASREIRHIWTDGRQHPPADELWPMHWGDSIGHWENQTLVIDTISIKGDLWLDPTGATLSDQAHIVERLSMSDRNHLRDEIMIVDPQALTRPWSFSRVYHRAPTKEMAELTCQWQPGEAARGSR